MGLVNCSVIQDGKKISGKIFHIFSNVSFYILCTFPCAFFRSHV